MRDVGIIEKFTTESSEILSRQPQTVEEIGEANAKHAEIMKTTPQVTCFICYTAVEMLIKKTNFKKLSAWLARYKLHMLDLIMIYVSVYSDSSGHICKITSQRVSKCIQTQHLS